MDKERYSTRGRHNGGVFHSTRNSGFDFQQQPKKKKISIYKFADSLAHLFPLLGLVTTNIALNMGRGARGGGGGGEEASRGIPKFSN